MHANPFNGLQLREGMRYAELCNRRR